MKITEANKIAQNRANISGEVQVIYRYIGKGCPTSIVGVEFDTVSANLFTLAMNGKEREIMQFVQTVIPAQWQAGYKPEAQPTPEPEFTPSQIRAMRDWVAECSWIEDEEMIDEMSDEEIIAGVRKHYEGGTLGFDFTGCE